MFIDTKCAGERPHPGGSGPRERARASLERAFAEPDAPRINRQVLREYLAVITRPQTVGGAPQPGGGPDRRGTAGCRLRGIGGRAGGH